MKPFKFPECSDDGTCRPWYGERGLFGCSAEGEFMRCEECALTSKCPAYNEVDQ